MVNGIRFYPESEKTNYHIVEFDRPFLPEFVPCHFNQDVFQAVHYLYRQRLLPQSRDIGVLVIFHVPDSIEIPFPEKNGKEYILDRSARVRFWLNEHYREGTIQISGGKITSTIPAVNDFLLYLIREEYLSVISGTGERILFLPLSSNLGFLSEHSQDDRLIVNSHFFLMDFTDLQTQFDQIGEPYGLLMINGTILIPPIYRRETLFFDATGKNMMDTIGIRDTHVTMDGEKFQDGQNAIFYTRPEHAFTPAGEGTDIAVVGPRIVGYSHGGRMCIPESGFVLHLPKTYIPENPSISYSIDTDYSSALQVGPLLIDSGSPASGFHSPYYRRGICYPPTVYPLNWKTDTAARMGFGFRDGRAVLIGIEGSKSDRYQPGTDSRGFSLAELACLAKENNLDNCINLDGGGSAKMLFGREKLFRSAEKNVETHEDYERPIPFGLSLGG